MTLATIDVDVMHAFGLTVKQMVGLLPQPGECLHLIGCWEPALPGSIHCTAHQPDPIWTEPDLGDPIVKREVS